MLSLATFKQVSQQDDGPCQVIKDHYNASRVFNGLQFSINKHAVETIITSIQTNIDVTK